MVLYTFWCRVVVAVGCGARYDVVVVDEKASASINEIIQMRVRIARSFVICGYLVGDII